MFVIALFSPVVSPFGLALALWTYPWRAPALRPYAGFVLALLAPLLCIVLLQAAFGLPPGSCVERPLNNLPFVLALTGIVAGAVLTALFKGYRRFVAGVAIAVCPLTLAWSMIATMSLAGCWI